MSRRVGDHPCLASGRLQNDRDRWRNSQGVGPGTIAPASSSVTRRLRHVPAFLGTCSSCRPPLRGCALKMKRCPHRHVQDEAGERVRVTGGVAAAASTARERAGRIRDYPRQISNQPSIREIAWRLPGSCPRNAMGHPRRFNGGRFRRLPPRVGAALKFHAAREPSLCRSAVRQASAGSLRAGPSPRL